jgi:eukaryotic-like serine/threonine-protein kinase
MAENPTHIGRYVVESELGRGAMGIIYRAQDPDIGRTVAIKLIRADLLEGDDREEFLMRFRHEARAAGRCTHTNIVAIYDFAMHEGNPFLAMEYVDGVGLGQALKGAGRFAPGESVAIVTQVLDALEAAHSVGVVHRDVKPANILLLPNGRVKVTDFGIARFNTSDLTQTGAVIGTPAYMSPEQCRGEHVDARSDLFSVGTVLYELLTGKRAFSGRNVTEVTYQLLSAEPSDVTTLVADVPEPLAAVLRKAMSKNREARYASAQQMGDALVVAMRRGADAASAGDRTVLMPPHAAFQPTPPAMDDTTLDTIERRLARYIGPIARRLVRDAARHTNSVEALCETVSRNIGQPADRDRFLADNAGTSLRRTGVTAAQSAISSPVASGIGTASGVAVSSDQIAKAERALTRVLGPLAKLLVKRALPGATSTAMLWERLAAHIERPADRDAFLKLKPNE